VSIPLALRTQYLRIIGNCVADNGNLDDSHQTEGEGSDILVDTNREIATKDITKIVDCLPSDDLTPIALAVLFNLCNDFGMILLIAGEVHANLNRSR
jgi:hypothetical protein